MTLPEISNIRMFNQQISSTKISGVKEIAGWMGAMQAQDYSMAKWAIGTRLSGASEKDIEITWWSGLPVRDARNALEMAKPHFISEKTDTNTYWLSGSFPGKLTDENHLYLLPAFDEFMISYKDRTPSLSLIHNKKAISNNGIFRPIVILNGQVAGLWKRTIKNDKALVETFFFKQVSKSVIRQIEKKVDAFGKFLDKETVVIHHKHDIKTIPA